ncbi:MAG TPA: DUF2442 domain-containing protein [Candidatus Absconditabacterales bacterium]|nr:DUF2442 domain-containing protein [Candidatus Absconditabacterales bacterium]
MIKLTTVKALPDYKLYLEFDDGVKGEIDMSSYVFGATVFSQLKNFDSFSSFSLNKTGSAIVWNDSADLDVMACYFKLSGINPLEYFKSEKYATA